MRTYNKKSNFLYKLLKIIEAEFFRIHLLGIDNLKQIIYSKKGVIVKFKNFNLISYELNVEYERLIKELNFYIDITVENEEFSNHLFTAIYWKEKKDSDWNYLKDSLKEEAFKRCFLLLSDNVFKTK